MKKGIGKLFRSPALLVIAVVVMMAAATLAYAHWSGTAPISGDVQTGYIGISWWDGETDDDGEFDGWDSGDTGEPSPAYDAWPGSDPYPCEPDNPDNNDVCEDPLSSSDPNQPYPYTVRPVRYDKDVALCTAWPEGDTLRFSVENGYPSYHCTIAGNMYGIGSVPVMTDGMEAGDPEYFYRDQCDFLKRDGSVWDGPVGWLDDGTIFADFMSEYDDGSFEGGPEPENWAPDGWFQPHLREFELTESCYEVPLTVRYNPDLGYYEVYDIVDDARALVLTFGASEGSCGVQVDPFFEDFEQVSPEDAKFRLWMHIENGAEQGRVYHMGAKAKFINWNEWAEFNSCSD